MGINFSSKNDWLHSKCSQQGRSPLDVGVICSADKLNRRQQDKALLEVGQALSEFSVDFSVQLFSSLKRWGLEEAHQKLDQWFELEAEPSP